MASISAWFHPVPVTLQELLDDEEHGETRRVLDTARAAQADIARLLPSDRKLVLEQIARLPSPRPLRTPDGKICPFEFTRRMIRLIESSSAAVSATSEKPRAKRQKAVSKGRSPSPGAHSGASRERSLAWPGEFRG